MIPANPNNIRFHDHDEVESNRNHINGAWRFPNQADPQADQSAFVESGAPIQGDTCLQCRYPLRDLQSWRCPECGYLNSRKEFLASKQYVDKTVDYVTVCVGVPPAILIGGFLILVIFDELFPPSRHGNGTIQLLAAILVITFLALQTVTLIRAAARVTQVTMSKRPKPPVLIDQPISAALLFLLHLSWLTLIPLFLCFGAVGCFGGGF